jgi:hypothetical protein
MPIDDSTIKTSLRLPRTLHAKIEQAAVASGVSLNAEMLLRLNTDPHANAAVAILEEIEKRDTQLAASLTRQIDTLLGALKRSDDVLERVASALSKASGEGEAATLKREVEFARELISAISSYSNTPSKG